MSSVKNGIKGFTLEIRWLSKLFNKVDTSCQMESEFVNHLMAASKSGRSWIPALMVRMRTFQGGGKGEE
jgi:hypothetical protein